MSEPEVTKESGQPSILTLRNVRDVVILVFFAVCIWKLIDSSLSVTFSNIDIQAVLNLLLALFSVGLSVAFYFKANETSNQFYDNVYKFTQDVSVILGRIEAGFGESLKNINERQASVQESVNRMAGLVNEAEDNVQERTEDVAKIKEDQSRLISELLDKAKVAADEKENILSTLEGTSQALYEKNQELTKAQLELQRLKEDSRMERIHTSTKGIKGVLVDYIYQRVFNFLPSNFSDLKINDASTIIQRALSFVSLSSSIFADLVNSRLITSDGSPTQELVERISQLHIERTAKSQVGI